MADPDRSSASVEWRPFCGHTSCPCMEPDITGTCEEFEDSGNPRCARCGWPERRHGEAA